MSTELTTIQESGRSMVGPIEVRSECRVYWPVVNTWTEFVAAHLTETEAREGVADS